MALPTFSESDLGQSQKWIDESNAKLLNRGLADGVQSCIDSAVQLIADYTARYKLETVRWKRLMQPLAIAEITRRLVSDLSPAVEAAWKAAMDELTQIRDGKFADLPLADDPVQEVSHGVGDWGSRMHVSMRRC